MRDQVDFLHVDKQGFLKLILLVLMVVVIHAQSTQNTKVAISYQERCQG